MFPGDPTSLPAIYLLSPRLVPAVRSRLPPHLAAAWPGNLDETYKVLADLSRPPTHLGRINMLKQVAGWQQPSSELFVNLHEYNSSFTRWQQALGLTDQEALPVYVASIHGEPLGSFARQSFQAFRGTIQLTELKEEMLQNATRIDELKSNGLSFQPRPAGNSGNPQHRNRYQSQHQGSKVSPSQPQSLQPAHAQPPTASTLHQARQFSNPPRLRPGEAAVLLAKGICLRCRKPGHSSDSCPDFPSLPRSHASTRQDHPAKAISSPKRQGQAPIYPQSISRSPQVRELVSVQDQQRNLPSPEPQPAAPEQPTSPSMISRTNPKIMALEAISGDPLLNRRVSVRAPVRESDVLVPFELDTGSDLTTIRASFAKELGLEPHPVPPVRLRTVEGREIYASSAVTLTTRLADDAPFRAISALVCDEAPSGNFVLAGLDSLQGYLIEFDSPPRVSWIDLDPGLVAVPVQLPKPPSLPPPPPPYKPPPPPPIPTAPPPPPLLASVAPASQIATDTTAPGQIAPKESNSSISSSSPTTPSSFGQLPGFQDKEESGKIPSAPKHSAPLEAISYFQCTHQIDSRSPEVHINSAKDITSSAPAGTLPPTKTSAASQPSQLDAFLIPELQPTAPVENPYFSVT